MLYFVAAAQAWTGATLKAKFISYAQVYMVKSLPPLGSREGSARAQGQEGPQSYPEGQAQLSLSSPYCTSSMADNMAMKSLGV